jgi:hypothetical protein
VPAELGRGDTRCVLELDGDTWIVLLANGVELRRELAAYEDTEPAHRLLHATLRRGSRPTPAPANVAPYCKRPGAQRRLWRVGPRGELSRVDHRRSSERAWR